MISSTVVTILFDEYLRLTNQEEYLKPKKCFIKQVTNPNHMCR